MLLRIGTAVLAVLVLMTGCTGSDEKKRPDPSPTASKATRLPALHTSWSVTAGDLWYPRPTDTVEWSWTTDDAVVVFGKRSVQSYAGGTGVRNWATRLPGTVCTVAKAPSTAGVGVVLTGSKNFPECTAASAFDLRTGKVLWSRTLTPLSHDGFDAVTVNAKTVVVTGTRSGDRLAVLAVATGRTIATRGGEDSRTYYTSASDGRTIVQGRETRNSAALVGYDARTGRRAWTFSPKIAVGDAHVRVHQVVASDPLIIDATIGEHRFLRIVDPARRTASLFGREIRSDNHLVTRRVGSRLVVRYGRGTDLITYDARTGRQLTHDQLDELAWLAAGDRDGSVLTESNGGVTSTDVRAGTQQVLAQAPDGYATAVVGNRLVAHDTDGRLTGYRLPARGVPAASVRDGVAWARGDIRPETMVDLCTGITAATKRALGFREPNLPAPAGCEWLEYLGRGGSRELDVSASAYGPSGKQSAAGTARSSVATRLKDTGSIPRLRRLPGLGDEALVGTHHDPDRYARRAQVVVRRANVIITITVFGDHDDRLDFLARGATLAARDALRELDRRR